jgi:2-oxoisovalerate dehydrogenase E2 component (dihydrolipoyl transacylase)
VTGTGPAGRITHEDLDVPCCAAARHQARRPCPQNSGRGDQGRRPAPQDRREDGAVKSRIPHITYVEEIDVTALEELRAQR